MSISNVLALFRTQIRHLNGLHTRQNGRHSTYVDQAFHRDPETGEYIVEVQIETFDDLFNTLDRAPFRRRDLSPDLKQFLYDFSRWVPLPAPMALEFLVASDSPDAERQADITDGIHNYFGYLVEMIQRENRAQRKRVTVFILLSFFFLSATVVLGKQLDATEVLQGFLLTGMTVGGWVFLWEALTIAFIRRHDVQRELAWYSRLAQARILWTFSAQSPVIGASTPSDNRAVQQNP